MALQDQYDLSELTNDSERLVFGELERQLSEAGPGVSRSQECVLDMAAYALNHVRPLYRANLLGRIYTQAPDEERRAEVASAVKDAIRVVTENPPV